MTSNGYFATAFCLLASFSTAYAETVRLTFSGSGFCEAFETPCDPVFRPSPMHDVVVTGGSGTILQVSGPHSQSALISSGSLEFETGPVYSVEQTVLGSYSDTRVKSGAGGTFNLSGSVFGRPGATLLSGTFSSASCHAGGSHFAEWSGCSGEILVEYATPVLLQSFGVQPGPGILGSGSLSGSEEFYYFSGGASRADVVVDFSPVPEPSALILSGLGLLIWGLAYVRRRRSHSRAVRAFPS